MTDHKMAHIAERHFAGLPPQPGEEEAYAALDLVAWELEMLRTAAGP